MGKKHSFSRLCKFSFLFRVIDLIFAPVCQEWFSPPCDKFILFVSVSNLVFSPVSGLAFIPVRRHLILASAW